jgi:tetratricopeptide (TPR) repeat protein
MVDEASRSGALIVRARSEEAAGRLEDAARLYSRAGHVEGTARCYYRLGDPERALAAILRLRRDDPGYGRACVAAIRIAAELDDVGFELDQFLGRFFARPPDGPREVEAFYSAALLYERHDFSDTARDILERIRDAHPGYKDVAERIDSIGRKSRHSPVEFERALEEDNALYRSDRRRSSQPPGSNEPSFPSLPDLPPASSRGARKATTQQAPPPPAPAHDEHGGPPPIPSVFDVPRGFHVAGRYRIEALIGRGGMAAVYGALDLEIEERIAIKLFAYGGGDPSMLSRFKQELALCRKITHPNVIRLYDIGTHADVRFITMELLSGRDLFDVMEDPPDLVRDLDYLVQLCGALQCVHDLGVVHRDLKPENVFVTDDGVVKLMDFGIAKRRSTERGITMSGFTAGTPAYMSPEQIQDFASATHLADLYSLGVIAYRIFTGRLPFDHDQATVVLMKHLRDEPEAPSSVNPKIPDELEFLILQLLEKDPARRIQSCRELARDLSALRSRLQSVGRRR